MKHILALSLAASVLTTCYGAAGLQRSEVVFMYEADAKTYAEYGATVLAWGGKPTPNALEQAKGVRFFGSVGMVTEFARYYERFPQTYEEGLCRDVNGQPVKVPWLTDQQHKGVPFWWCCTQQPLFRKYLHERVTETIAAGAEGVHIDDHLGTAGGLWLGTCFCDRCVEGFREYLKSLPADELQRLGIDKPAEFDFRQTVKQWIAAEPSAKRTAPQHRLWPEWTIFQCRSAAAFMVELHQLADQAAGHHVPMGANAGLLWPLHLSDYQTLDLFSAETDHHASARHFSDAPIFAYRLADAVARPYMSTASGGDWAYIKEQNLPGLVRGWVALSYAAGHCFMVPNRQWCYTPEKGTHWYEGPAEKFAPLYQFVRHNAALFDGYENRPDLAIVIPHRSFRKDPNRWFEMCGRLAATNLSYRLVLGGDEIVRHPLPTPELDSAAGILIPDTSDLDPADRKVVAEQTSKRHCLSTVDQALAETHPAVRVPGGTPVRAMVRAKPGSVVVHLLNYDYDAAHDEVRPIKDLKVTLDVKALGIPPGAKGRFVSADAAELAVSLKDGLVEIPSLNLWGLLVFDVPRSSSDPK